MNKTRPLTTVSFGNFSATNKYYGTYRNMYCPIDTLKKTLLWVHEYGLSMANHTVAPNLIQGFEEISSTERKYQDNWCNHTRYRRVNYPYSTAIKGLYWSDTKRSIKCYPFLRRNFSWVPPVITDGKNYFYECLGKVHDGLRAEAYWTLRPKFEGELSMLNFLFELKDFKDIAKLLFKRGRGNPLRELSDALAGYKRSQNAVNQAIKNAPGAALSSFGKAPTKIGSQGLLSYNFAIKPLIADLSDIFKQMHQMVDEAERLFLENGKGTRRYFSKWFDPVATLTTPTSETYAWFSQGTSMRGVFTAKASMTYDYTPRSKFNRTCDYWGLVPTAEAVWNALPFSFLVDYFFTVGKSLQMMRKDMNLSNYHLVSYSESVAAYYDFGRFISSPASGTNLGLVVDDKYYPSIEHDRAVLHDGCACSFYQREFPPAYYGPALPQFKLPNSSQTLNMLALARCMLDFSR